MGRAELVPEYANVAFNLQDPNKVSKIVESEFGFHIIQLIEKRGDRINTRHILLKPKWMKKIWKQPCYVWILLPMISVMRNLLLMMPLLISLTIRTRVNNHGLMANPQTGTARLKCNNWHRCHKRLQRWWKA